MSSSLEISWTHLSKVLEDYAKEFVQYLRDSYVSDDRWEHLANDTLIQSVKYILDLGDRELSVSISLHDYWKFVEFGRGPGKFPPVSAMTSYVELKPVLPRPDKNGKLPTNKQLAYLIGHKIATKGTQGTYNFENTCNYLNEKYDRKIEDAVSQDIEEDIDFIFIRYFK